MDLFDKDLQELVTKGKTQGYLTYDEVNDYLPDEEVNPERLDNLLIALEEEGIDLVNQRPEPTFYDPTEQEEGAIPGGPAIEEDFSAPAAEILSLPGEQTKFSSDPIRMYLSQMAEIPLLARAEEISLAKKIEVTRKRFRRTVLGCNMAMKSTIATLAKVHKGGLPFDRTIKVSLTERLTKEQIIARMPLNLKYVESHGSGKSPRLRQIVEQAHVDRRSGRRPENGSSAGGAKCSRWWKNSVCARGGFSR